MGKFAQFLGKLGLPEITTGAILAPMAGVSDLGMRQVAQTFGASLVVSEMVDGDFLAKGDRQAQSRISGDGLAAHVVQIAGCSSASIAEAARLAEAQGAALVDINMGCPAKKVVGGLAGSALMRDLDQAAALVRAAVRAVAVPVSVKMRLGWDEATLNAPELARRAEIEGAVMITVHGRTRCQFYNGRADWSAIQPVVEAVRIPVVANGDCRTVEDARAMLGASGAAAVMIGRAAIGRPWLVGDIAHALMTGEQRQPISRSVRREAALLHYATILSCHGRERGVRHARKHLAGYATHAGHPPQTPLHRALVTEEDADAALRGLARLFDGPSMEMAA